MKQAFTEHPYYTRSGKELQTNNCTARRETSSVCSGSLYCAPGIINRAKTTAVILCAVVGDFPPNYPSYLMRLEISSQEIYGTFASTVTFSLYTKAPSHEVFSAIWSFKVPGSPLSPH